MKGIRGIRSRDVQKDGLRWLGVWLIASCLGVGGMHLPAAQANEPEDVVRTLQTALLAAMQEAETLGYQGRYERLKPVVLMSHDIPFVARLAVGKFWKTFTEEQRMRFVEAFQELSIAMYAGRFDGYSGEQFRIVSQRPLPRGKMLVETRFIKSDGQQLQFNYLLRPVDKGWRIINITVDGVSDLALKRAEYTTLVKTEGFEALLQKMRSQIKKYANGED